jgi:predicted nucleic acid-binding Zn ribbon protein
LKRLVVGGVLGGIIGSEAMRGATRVKKEDLDKAMERPESFDIHLQDIIGAKVEKQFGASLLCIDCSTPGMSRAQLYRAGAVSSFKGFDDWIGEINSAKQRVATMPQQAPQPMYTPTPMQAPQLIQETPNTRFCPSCGQPINQQDKFCLNCGANLQAQPAVCPKCGNAVNPGQKFCNMCGTQMR